MIYLTLFLTFFKIGAFTFGGGYAMLPMIQQEVASHGWMTGEELVNFIAVSEATPGPFAINVSTYVGTETAGLAGALAATSGVVLPSFLIILAIARIYTKFQKSTAVQGVMTGLRPAVVGLIGAAILSVAAEVFLPSSASIRLAASSPSFWISAGILALCIFLSVKKIHPVLILGIAAAAGTAAGYAGLLS